MPFDSAFAFTASQEAGWYDGSNPADPNPTMKGVTQHTYDLYRTGHALSLQSVQLIADAELQDIYRTYWLAAHCDALGALSGVVVFDHALNRGPVPAVLLVQRTVGVHADGVFGPATTAAVAAMDDVTLAARLLWGRLADYYQVALANQSERPDLVSWLGRTMACGKVVGAFT